MQNLEVFQRLYGIGYTAFSVNFDSAMLYWKAIVGNCLYLYQTVPDLSVQTMCSRLLLQIMRKIEHSSTVYEALVSRGIITAIHKMLKSKDEKVRFEFIQMLAEIVKIFPQDKELGQLGCLSDQNIDLDFFSNVTHLQNHR